MSSSPKPSSTPIPQEILDAITKGIAQGTIALNSAGLVGVSPVAAPVRGPQPTCNTCRQKESACGKEHRKVAVYPRHYAYGKWFQGVWLNGVRYLSNSAHHLVDIPKDFAVEHLIESWEKNEMELSTGRQAEHDSGSVTAFNPAHSAYR